MLHLSHVGDWTNGLLSHVCCISLEISDTSQLKKQSLHDLHIARYIAARSVRLNRVNNTVQLSLLHDVYEPSRV
jgi:hypothetical protein